MVRISVRVETELVRQNLQNLFAEVPKIGKFKIRNLMERIRNRMGGPGKKSTRPVKWDSEKQRKAYFATDGFGRGIPTQRTGKYQRGWKVKALGESGYTLSNSQAGAKYIGGSAYGTGQSRIHMGRWVLLRDATDLEVSKLPAEILKEIRLVSRRKGFAK